MTGDEVTEAMKALGYDRLDVAIEFKVSERTVRRWQKIGVSGAPVAALAAFMQCQRLGVPCRLNEVSVSEALGWE